MLNKVTLIGNLGKDIEVRTLDNGTKVGTLSLATTESYKDKSDQWQKVTEWHNIVVWKPSDSTCKLVKGNLVYIEGKIKSRKYNYKEGIERTAVEIVSTSILRLDRVGYGESAVKSNEFNYVENNSQTVGDLGTSDDNDDLPF